MAPKKKAVDKAKVEVSAKSTRSTGRAAQDTVTTKRGKEYETTAAARRPTRAAAQRDLSFPDTRPSARATETGKKRSASANAAKLPRKRSRPAKSAAVATSTAVPGRRVRGRPPKTATTKTAPALKASATPKKRGRPAKETIANGPPTKRGKPSRTALLADAVPPEDEQPAPKKHGGHTTKIDVDDETAAQQLEEELLSKAEEPTKLPAKRGHPTKGKGKQIATEDDAIDLGNAGSGSGRQYWLMKAEQDGHDEKLADGTIVNTKFTIDDLRSKLSAEPWDGVRNASAAKNMREMKQGDLAFFYASGGKTPGIVGTMEIVREHEPDTSASDENSHGYVSDEKQRGRWCVVHVAFRSKLSKPVTRAQLIQAKDEGPLAKMQEFTAARLSVSKVSEDEWRYIHSLIEGFEEDGQHQGDDALVHKEGTPIDGEESNVLRAGDVEDQEENLPILFDSASTVVMESTEEPSMPTTDTLLPQPDGVESPAPAIVASSRPTSRSTRAGSASRGAVLKATSRPASRVGPRADSLAAPSSRGRSKTPRPRGGSVQPPSSSGLMQAIGEE